MPLPSGGGPGRELLEPHSWTFAYRRAKGVLLFLACMRQLYTLWHGSVALTGSGDGRLVCRF